MQVYSNIHCYTKNGPVVWTFFKLNGMYIATNGEDTIVKNTYLEWGGRSDHLDDAIATARGKDVPVRRVSEAQVNETERQYVGSNKRNGIESASLQTVEVG